MIFKMDNLNKPIKIYGNNSLLNIMNWLQSGAYVIIHNENGRFFHKCRKENLRDDEIKDYINNHRFIYIDVSKMPGLLEDGEWNWYIKNGGFDECECSLKEVSSEPKDIPYKDILCI